MYIFFSHRLITSWDKIRLNLILFISFKRAISQLPLSSTTDYQHRLTHWPPPPSTTSPTVFCCYHSAKKTKRVFVHSFSERVTWGLFGFVHVTPPPTPRHPPPPLSSPPCPPSLFVMRYVDQICHLSVTLDLNPTTKRIIKFSWIKTCFDLIRVV